VLGKSAVARFGRVGNPVGRVGLRGAVGVGVGLDARVRVERALPDETVKREL